MTKTQIEKEAAKANRKYELARQIRELLDAAKKEYGAEWGNDDVEAEVQRLVFDEE